MGWLSIILKAWFLGKRGIWDNWYSGVATISISKESLGKGFGINGYKGLFSKETGWQNLGIVGRKPNPI